MGDKDVGRVIPGDVPTRAGPPVKGPGIKELDRMEKGRLQAKAEREARITFDMDTVSFILSYVGSARGIIEETRELLDEMDGRLRKLASIVREARKKAIKEAVNG